MERLILCGGGHVSLELAWMAARLEFEVIVLDDRTEFANETRFPMAAQVLCMPFEEALDQLGSRESDFYAILTRGHAFDKDCLAHVLRGKYAYAGMIGSRTKVAAVTKALLEEGFSQEMLDGVYAPIGLSIGGQTPAEIAVSIAAQLVQVRSALGPNMVKPPGSRGCCVPLWKSTAPPPGVWAPGCWCGPMAAARAPSAADRWSIPPSATPKSCGAPAGRRRSWSTTCPTPPPSWVWCAAAG